MAFLRKLRLPAKFHITDRYFAGRAFRMLDIGAGNHSATVTKQWYPDCEYYGVDLDKHYNNDAQDFRAMTEFYEMDLEALDFSAIPDDFFDFIMMSHILEHLKNGDVVVERLLPKLRQGGIIYIEFPGYTSTKLPHMKGTLNFFDDDTHRRVYSLGEFYNLLMRNEFRVLNGGTMRRWHTIVLIPFKIPHNLLRYGRIVPSIFWDLLGFAEYVIARKR